MIDIVMELLESHGLMRMECQDFELFGKPKHTNQTAYWIVVNQAPELSAEVQSKWLNTCISITKDPALSKNVSILYLWQVPEFSNDVFEKVRLAEEDLYFFKKHVLPYTSAELEELRQVINDSNISRLFSELATDRNTFSNYKSNTSTGGWESLIYRLAIKLPLLSMGNSSTASLSDLEEKIERNISRNSDSDLLGALVRVVDSTPNLKDLTDDEAFSSLIQSLAQEGYEL